MSQPKFRLYGDRPGRFMGKWKCPFTSRWLNKKVPTAIADRAEAEAWFEAWLARTTAQAGAWPSNAQVAVPRPPPTLRNLMERWVQYRLGRPQSDRSEVEAMRACANKWALSHPMADLSLEGDLTVGACAQWVDHLLAKRGPTYTVRNIVQTVRTIVSDCAGMGWARVQGNPLKDDFIRSRLKGIGPKAGKDVIVALTVEQAKRLLGYKAADPERHCANVVALCTGLRASELAALCWGDVELDAEVPLIRVNRQLVAGGSKPKFKLPKRGSKRLVPLHPVAVEVLKARRGSSPRSNDAPVFPDADGHFHHPTTANKFRIDLAEAGIDTLFDCGDKRVPFTFHALRRSFATMLTDAGVAAEEVKALMGHAAAGVTARHYVQKNLPRLQAAIAKLPLQ